MDLSISNHINALLTSDPSAPLLEWRGAWLPRRIFTAFNDSFGQVLGQLGIAGTIAAAIAARNRPQHCMALMSLLAREQPISMLYAFQSAEALARDVANGRFALVVLDEEDWSAPVAHAADEAGTCALLITETAMRLIEPSRRMPLEHAHRTPEAGIEVLSSGTTGPPKRVFHPHRLLFRSLAGVPRRDDTPEVVSWPLAGIGGFMNLAMSIFGDKPFLVMEKFNVDALVDMVKRHGLTSLALSPTMLRMIYDANVPLEDFKTLTMVHGGSGALDLDLQDKFEARYGKPVLWALGATEFCGTVIAWSLEDYLKLGKAKRGSTGRVLPGCEVRIVDDAGAPLPFGETGRMRVKVDALGPDFIETTDLAAMDADGFVFHKGRADGAIVRGGFKVLPEKVCEMLRLHPAIAEAAVIGVADARLGQAPVAVIEPRPGQNIDAEEAERHLRSLLPSPHIPARFLFVDKLPYTDSLKVHLAEVRKLVAAATHG